MLAILILPLLVSLPTQAPAKAPAAASTFIPADSLFVWRVSSPDAVVRALAPFVGPGDPAVDPLDMLKMSAGVDARWDLIDRSKPIVVAGNAADGPVPFALTIVATVKDAAAFASHAPLIEAGWTCTAAGNQVAISAGKPGPTLAADAPILVGLDRHDLVVRIAMDKVMVQYGEMIHGFLDQMVEAAEEEPDPASSAAAAPIFGAIADAVDSVEMYEIHFSQAGGETRLGLEMTAIAGTSLASVTKVDATGLSDMARMITPDAAISFLSVIDFAKYMSAFEGLFDSVTAGLPDEGKAQFDAMMKSSKELYASIGPAMAASVDIDAEGIHGAGAMRTKEPAAYVAKVVEIFRAGIPWMPITGPEVSKVDGIDVTTLRMKIDFDKMPMPDDVDTEMGAEERAKASEAVNAMFGPDGMELSMATRDGTVVTSFGGIGELKAALARMGSKTPSPVGTAMLQALGNMNPGFVYRMDLGKLFDGFAALGKKMSAIDESAGAELEAMMPLRALPPMMVAGGIDGRVWKLAITTDGKKLADVIQSMRGPAVTTRTTYTAPKAVRAKVDIMSIMTALDDYAMNNAAHYPDSLVPLVTPDVNGHRYLNQEKVPVDPWGREYLYDPPGVGQPRPKVYTLGADGKPGGEGDDADMDNVSIMESPR